MLCCCPVMRQEAASHNFHVSFNALMLNTPGDPAAACSDLAKFAAATALLESCSVSCTACGTLLERIGAYPPSRTYRSPKEKSTACRSMGRAGAVPAMALADYGAKPHGVRHAALSCGRQRPADHRLPVPGKGAAPGGRAAPRMPLPLPQRTRRKRDC